MGKQFAVAVSALAVMGLGAGGALAGEVKGPPRTEPGASTNYTAARSHANSICAYSGLNDNPTSTNMMDPPGRVQSFGQDVKLYGAVPQRFNPGDVCQGGSNHNRT